jgi:hypothetical protein
MKYNKNKYLGKTVQLYPTDSAPKFGIITDLDDLGFTIKITESRCKYYIVGKEYFFTYSTNLSFMFVN